ncbi:MAG: hypothetical protein ACJ764_10910 [Solirubrobacteraceae bacterium]
MAAVPSIASASTPCCVQHLNYAAGPYNVTPGSNLILTQINQVPKPTVDGFVVKMIPNLRYALPNGKCCGGVPLTKNLHLHHGVWLSDGRAGQGEGNGTAYYPFMASGEEKTITEFPKGFGYPVAKSDHWILNYMIHNLSDRAAKVYINYTLWFVPDTTPLAHTLTAAHPIWMDVRAHNLYPVFDVKRHSGVNGKYTYPDMANQPYGKGSPLNEFTLDHAGTLIGTAGHVHPGGLSTDLDLIRSGATPSGGALPGPVPNSVRLFRSVAHYFKHRGPVSWDVAMGTTNADWRPKVRAGDVLRVSTTYETKLASWYEVMGIMVVWEAWDDTHGTDPFAHALDQTSHLTHGHLKENSYYGGTAFIGVNPTQWPLCDKKKVLILGFRYLPGDFKSPKGSANHCVPTTTAGHSIKFVNQDANPMGVFRLLNPSPFYLQSITHAVTSCHSPCNKNYGISYPVANGGRRFDSGQLGIGLPGVGRLSWSTPASLPPGTYTFFCRIHPWMRGVFRIIQ